MARSTAIGWLKTLRRMVTLCRLFSRLGPGHRDLILIIARCLAGETGELSLAQARSADLPQAT